MRERIVESKRQENDNLAKVFEEHVARTIRAAEVTLQEIGSEYRRSGMKFDLARYAKDRGIYLDPYNILSIVDENGDLILANSLLSRRISLRETDSYQFHAQHDTPEIFISLPRRGSTTGKWTVYLTRRINKADGSFGGLASVGMDPSYFSRIYAELELGKDSVVSMIARDGIIRARSAGAETTAGENVAGTALFTRYLPAANHGSFIGPGAVDRIARILSYAGLPRRIVGGRLLGALKPRRARPTLARYKKNTVSGQIHMLDCSSGIKLLFPFLHRALWPPRRASCPLCTRRNPDGRKSPGATHRRRANQF